MNKALLFFQLYKSKSLKLKLVELVQIVFLTVLGNSDKRVTDRDMGRERWGKPAVPTRRTLNSIPTDANKCCW